MRKIKMIIFVILFFTISSCSHRLSSVDIEKLYKNNDVVLIDLRERSKYVNGHIPGAQWIKYHPDTFGGEIFKHSQKTTFVLYCCRENNSKKAIHVLKKCGYCNFYILKNGFDAWKKSGHPIEKGISRVSHLINYIEK